MTLVSIQFISITFHAFTTSHSRSRAIPIILISMVNVDHSFHLCQNKSLNLLGPAAFVMLLLSYVLLGRTRPCIILCSITLVGLSVPMALETLPLIDHCTAGL
jgi:hypothetical protein